MNPLRHLLIFALALCVHHANGETHTRLSPYLSCQATPLTRAEINRGYQPVVPVEDPSTAIDFQSWETREGDDAKAALLLSEKVSGGILAYLEQSKNGIDLIADRCLRKMNNWTDPLPAGCPALTHTLLYTELPRIVRTTRLALSLSINASASQSWRLWSLNDVMNPRMATPIMSPLSGRWEPLTEAETKVANEVLIKFWDGPSSEDKASLNQGRLPLAIKYLFTAWDPFDAKKHKIETPTTCAEIENNHTPVLGVIDEYMGLLRCKIDRIKGLPHAPPGLLEKNQAQLEKFEQSRRLTDPVKRVEAAMLIGDQGWRSYSASQLENFRQRNRFVLWAAAETLRPAAFISKARPTPADVLQAFLTVKENNQKIAGEVRTKMAKIKQNISGSTSEVFDLLSYHQFVAATVADDPSLCSIATRLFNAKENEELLSAAVTGFVVLAPFVLLNPTVAAAVGPIAANLITVTAAGVIVYSTVQQLESAQHQQDQFLSLLARQPFGPAMFPEAEDVLASKNSATLNATMIGTSFALPLINFSKAAKLLKLIVR